MGLGRVVVFLAVLALTSGGTVSLPGCSTEVRAGGAGSRAGRRTAPWSRSRRGQRTCPYRRANDPVIAVGVVRSDAPELVASQLGARWSWAATSPRWHRGGAARARRAPLGWPGSRGCRCGRWPRRRCPRLRGHGGAGPSRGRPEARAAAAPSARPGDGRSPSRRARRRSATPERPCARAPGRKARAGRDGNCSARCAAPARARPPPPSSATMVAAEKK